MIYFAFINAFMVIVTALDNQLYHFLKLNMFSGFNKSLSVFRSPGLLRGFDNSGFLALIAIVLCS